MGAKETEKRYLLLLAGLAVMALGVAFSIRADLGTSPISSLPYVASGICGMSVGDATILMHCAFVFFQIALLRRQFKKLQLLQLAVAIVFGYMIDAGMWLTESVSYSNYTEQWALCLVGIVLVGAGVRMEVSARAVPVAGEGLVIALSKVTGVKFGNMKISFDVALVIVAVALSLVFEGRLLGVREGTVAAAIGVGEVAKLLQKPMGRAGCLFSGKKRQHR